jgi:nicotinate phosphoribosyltransferase
MAYGYWKKGLHERRSVFHLFFRKPPFKGGFTVVAGLEQALEFISNFRFDEEDLAYLSSFFEPAFIDYLRTFRFTCDVDGVPEGTVMFSYEPLLRVEGPLIECQLLESPLLNLINFPTLIATKAARISLAAGGDTLLEFGMRRAQGIDGALTASRAAYIGGCDATSNVLAGKKYGIPVRGTHAHSWVMAFEDEEESFRQYAKCLPDNVVLLVDTYHSIEGIKKALHVAKELKEQGKPFHGIRLDSGDLAYLSIQARRMMNEAGFPDAKIYASNELDETVISELKRQGAEIDAWGVGTNLVTAKDQPALDGVYKLSALQDVSGKWHNKLKLSEQMLKISNPGFQQVRRFTQNGEFVGDAIYDLRDAMDGDLKAMDLLDPTKEWVFKKSLKADDLLQPLFKKGVLVYNLPSLTEIRERVKQQLSYFPAGIKRFLNPHLYPVGMEERLYKEKVRLVREIRERYQ